VVLIHRIKTALNQARMASRVSEGGYTVPAENLDQDPLRVWAALLLVAPNP
jgi:hypothetical protein